MKREMYEGLYNDVMVAYNDDRDPITALSSIPWLGDAKQFENAHILVMLGESCESYDAEGTVVVTKSNDSYLLLLDTNIGGGISAVNIGKVDLDTDKLEKVIKSNVLYRRKEALEIPSGFRNTRLNIQSQMNRIAHTLGTIGRGDFIGICEDASGDNWLVIDSDARLYGRQLYREYGDYANKDGILLDDKYAAYFINDMLLCNEFAKCNKENIIITICKEMGWKYDWNCNDIIHCLNNYLACYSTPYKAYRRHAISAKTEDNVIVWSYRFNCAVIGKGKGNPHYLLSAPAYDDCISDSTWHYPNDDDINKKEALSYLSEFMNIETIASAKFVYKAGWTYA